MTQPAYGEMSGPPVCYRHPDRIAYVRCQRCNRPICPECQVPAPVGVLCPDCAKAAEQRIAPARTALGAPLRDGKPVITIAIVVACAVAFIAQQLVRSFNADFSFIPAFAQARPWTYLTSAFLHWGIFHILMNMYALWVVGSFLEQILGRARYLVLYVVCAIGSSVAVLVLATPSLQGTWMTMTAGASGAIFGLFATILMVTKRLGRNPSGIYAVIAINVVFNLASIFLGGGLSWQGHVGGFVTGLALGAAFAYAPKERIALVSVGATVVVLAVLVALVAWKYSITPPEYFAHVARATEAFGRRPY